MQGKLISLAILGAALTPSAAVAGEVSKRQACNKAEQPSPTQQRQQQQQQQRNKTPECRVQKVIPPVVDPTPYFLL